MQSQLVVKHALTTAKNSNEDEPFKTLTIAKEIHYWWGTQATQAVQQLKARLLNNDILMLVHGIIGLKVHGIGNYVNVVDELVTLR